MRATWLPLEPDLALAIERGDGVLAAVDALGEHGARLFEEGSQVRSEAEGQHALDARQQGPLRAGEQAEAIDSSGRSHEPLGCERHDARGGRRPGCRPSDISLE